MFRKREQSQPQTLESMRLSRFQRRRLVNSWPVAFREQILPLLREEDFAHFFHPTHGAPNCPVQVVLGILLLKDMFSLSDNEALDHFAFDLRWHVALDVVAVPLSCCQKTLHNFRVRLRDRDATAKVFFDLAFCLKDLLELDTKRQRLDSTHVRSDCAILTRLGLFCESIRLFLRRLSKDQPACFSMTPEQLRLRYCDDEGQASRYDHAQSDKGRRRLPVVARDLQRLLDVFGDLKELQDWPELTTCRRLKEEQCHSTEEPVRPKEGDDDSGLGAASVQPRQPKDISAASLQTPHDPDVTYGKKGQGYEVHIAETFGNKTEEEPDKPELITYASVMPSCSSDVHFTIPVLKSLKERGMQPEELEVDSNYTSSTVILEARQMGTEVNGPVKGRGSLPTSEDVTLGDFQVDVEDAQKSKCPQGHAPSSQEVVCKAAAAKEVGTPQTEKQEEKSRRISLGMLTTVCAVCCVQSVCPMGKAKESKECAGQRELRFEEEELVSSQRRRYQTTAAYQEKYRNRAGIEATNSEAKRAHGLGKLRVRGQERVQQAVYLKLTACNVKRVVHYLSRVAKAQE